MKRSFEERVSDEDRRACLRSVSRHLRRDGRFVCTTHDVPSRLATMGEGKGRCWRFVGPRSKPEPTLSLETAHEPARPA
ncbi:MAG TPA: hypothetical protein VK886_01145 [Vicinamibacterales bacterium]|nr:hypothetical protein [Vicinamibacterales bacterium]